MKIELYQYGLTNALRDIAETLERAFNTTDKNQKEQFVREAYGMVKTIDTLLIDEFEDA